MSTLNTGSLTVGLSPGFQELGLQRPTAIPQSQRPAKTTTLLCKRLDWTLRRYTHRYVRTTVLLS